jgi:hypothetical protein
MPTKIFREQIIVVRAKFDAREGTWNVDVEITRRFTPPDKFATEKNAEEFGFQLAEHWIKTRA